MLAEMQSGNKPNIVAIFGSSMRIDYFVRNFVDILEPLSNELYVITRGYFCTSSRKIHTKRIKAETKQGQRLINAAKLLLVQTRVSFYLLRICRKVDIIIFHVSTREYVIPIIWAKLLRKKVVSVFTGLESKSYEITHGQALFGLGRIILPFIARILERINLSLADQVAVESPSAMNFMGFSDYKEKVVTNGALYMETDIFRIKKDLKDKTNLIGYIGRLSKTKGVMNFVRALPQILRQRGDTEFIIGGDGPTYHQIEGELVSNDLQRKVRLVGWVPHEEVPDYLNELKFLVFPSYTEGLPGVVQEAMACGTIVIATPVGGVPDLIKDGETGFIMEDNSPECIARNVIRAVEHPGLSEIVQNARCLIEREYTYEVMVEKCKRALDKLMKDGKRGKSNL